MNRVKLNGIFKIVTNVVNNLGGATSESIIVTSIKGVLYEATENEKKLHGLKDYKKFYNYTQLNKTAKEELDKKFTDLEAIVEEESKHI